MPSNRKGSGYSIIRDFSLQPVLILMVTAPSRPRSSRQTSTLENPGSKTNILTSKAVSILTPHNSCKLIPRCLEPSRLGFGPTGIHMTTTLSLRTNRHPKRVLELILGLDHIVEPGSSWENSHPQAILKFHPSGSF